MNNRESQLSPDSSGKVFISYRTAETEDIVARLADDLGRELAPGQLFFDRGSIGAGESWPSRIRGALEQAAVVLVILGRGWLKRSDPDTGRRLIDIPSDWVRNEIATALRRGIKVVPILVGGATMPASDALPPVLRDLTSRQALPLRARDWRADVARIVDSLSSEGIRLRAHPSATHAAFVDRVASIYGRLRYTVERDVGVDGGAVDLIVRRYVIGVGGQAYAIFCHTRNATVLDPVVVDEIVGITVGLHDSGQVTAGLIVSEYQVEVAHPLPAILRTMAIGELERQSSLRTEVYETIVRDYQESDIYRRFVSPRGYEGEQLVPDLVSMLESWIDSRDGGIVSIIGDFGTGKTTLLERLRYTYAKSLLAEATDIRPILMRLRSYSNHGDVDLMIGEALRKHLGPKVEVREFWQNLHDGRVLLLLDALDEMTQSHSVESRRQNLELLRPMLAAGSPVVITSRPNYFDSEEEMIETLRLGPKTEDPALVEIDAEFAQSARRRAKKQHIVARLTDSRSDLRPVEARSGAFRSRWIRMRLFDQQQVDEYLRSYDAVFRKKCSASWSEVKEFLMSIFDLRDLMRRPMLLEMLAETVSTGHLDIREEHSDVSAFDLYEIYTSQKLAAEVDKGRCLLDAKIRREFAMSIALAMHDEKTLDVGIEDVRRIASSTYTELRDAINADVVMISADLQLCSFLQRDPDNRSRFAHKSFMEFFVAYHILDHLERGLREGANRLGEPVSPEVIHFLAGCSPNQRKKLVQLRRQVEPLRLSGEDVDMLATNVEHIILLWRGVVSDVMIRDHRLKAANLAGIRWRNADVEGFELESATVRGFALVEGRIVAGFSNSELRGVEFENSEIKIEFDNCDLTDIKTKDSHLDLAGQARLQELDARGGSICFGHGCEVAKLKASNVALACKLARIRDSRELDAVSLQLDDQSVWERVEVVGSREHSLMARGRSKLLDGVVRGLSVSLSDDVDARRLKFLGVSLSCTASQIRECETRGSNVALLKGSSWKGGRMSDSRVAVAESRLAELAIVRGMVRLDGRSGVSNSKLKGVEISVGGGASILGCELDSCEIDADEGAKLERSRILARRDCDRDAAFLGIAAESVVIGFSVDEASLEVLSRNRNTGVVFDRTIESPRRSQRIFRLPVDFPVAEWSQTFQELAGSDPDRDVADLELLFAKWSNT